ncbi:cytochrome P450 [Byssothecium circinans]|uniref:Cytochrome P450 n=1 Tax=Byssothecium circinans TaxID=147558 RepID=A0A6A5TTL6_9PLEO|nr:cytochrome P450 [Byssothecium circinans]
MGWIVLSCGLYFAYWALRAIYRLHFHPLSRYRGSKVAAVSNSWYEWYWNYYLNGQMIFEIARLHKEYGPVVRIGVNDLSIDDPEVYQAMTKVNSGFTKDPHFYRCISFPGTSIGETDPAKSRIRRKVLTPALSGTRVQDLAPAILAKVERLLRRVDLCAKSAKPICVTSACKAFTMDVISKIVLGREIGCIDEPDFRNEFIENLNAAFKTGWIATAFPRLATLALWMASMSDFTVIPNPLIDFKRKCRTITKSYLEAFDPHSAAYGADKDVNVPSAITAHGDRSAVIDMLMDPLTIKGHTVPNLEQLNDEAVILLTAGNDTTSNSMIFGLYQICNKKSVYETLFQELQAHFPSVDQQITYEDAKQLPYLTATIKEILRLGSPLPGRLPRLIPSSGFRLYGQNLPPKTSIRTSPYLLNRHPSVWDNPNDFNPNRWLGEYSRDLDKYLATFNRGARQCLGKDLAWCELLVFFANLFRRYHIETLSTDMRWRDLILVRFEEDLYAWVEKRVE